MLNPDIKKQMENQAYRFVGNHSAVKTCGWTKKMIKQEGSCYKQQFYGIMSHQCLQMTTSLSCGNRCVFCWRGYKAPVTKEWIGEIDDPQIIIDGSIKAHLKLLEGYKGNSKTDQLLFKESKEVRHVALSLTGEPITYPRINELLDLFHKNNISTFLVTNSQYPEEIKNLGNVTQLYCSLDAPNKELLKKVDVPLFTDYWERSQQSLEELSKKKCRTCIRITLIAKLNDVEPENYARQIILASPDFVEVKSYMFVGESKLRLNLENMPWHEDVVAFSKKILAHLPEYDIVTEHIPSRVVLLAKKKFFKNNKWHTWINFNQYLELVNSKKEVITEDYLLLTPITGLSGRNTREEAGKLKNKKN
ncbi:MAG: 4-demethylwyosine synthase TYW1 [Candidatus Woesearchaeota archaeon]|jgi:tRNA wybutosine-synthesizing protein 1